MVKQFGGDANQFSLFKTRLEASIRKEGLFYSNVLKQRGVFSGMTYDPDNASDFVTVSYEDLVRRGVLGLSSLVCKDLGMLSESVLGNMGVFGKSENFANLQGSESEVGNQTGPNLAETSTKTPQTPDKSIQGQDTKIEENRQGVELKKSGQKSSI